MRLRTLFFACTIAAGAPFTRPSIALARDGDAGTPATSPYDWRGPVSDVERSIAACLRASRRAGEGASGPIVARITHLPPPVPPVVDGLFEILIQGRVPKVTADDAPQKLSVPQRALVLGALARLPSTQVREALEARLLLPVKDVETRTAVVDVLGVVGDAHDLARLGGLSARDTSGELLRDSKTSLQTAYAGILRRDAHAFAQVASLLAGKDVHAAQVLLFAMSDLRDRRVLGSFYEVAHTRPDLAQTAIALVPRLANTNDVEVAHEFAAWLRSAVDPNRKEWTRAVYAALGTLDEGDACPALIGSLDSDDKGLRDAAWGALRKISGLSLQADRQPWENWFEQESTWFETTRSEQRTNLASENMAEVVAALRSYCEHRLFKRELTRDLLPMLDSQEPVMRELACQTLGQIRSPAAVRGLLEVLSDPEPSVQKAAREALHMILGTEIPEDAGVAREQVAEHI